jgi:hypothetical protein
MFSTLEVLTCSGHVQDFCTHIETFDNRVVLEHNAVERVGTSTKAVVGTFARTHESWIFHQQLKRTKIEGRFLTAYLGVSVMISVKLCAAVSRQHKLKLRMKMNSMVDADIEEVGNTMVVSEQEEEHVSGCEVKFP